MPIVALQSGLGRDDGPDGIEDPVLAYAHGMVRVFFDAYVISPCAFGQHLHDQRRHPVFPDFVVRSGIIARQIRKYHDVGGDMVRHAFPVKQMHVAQATARTLQILKTALDRMADQIAVIAVGSQLGHGRRRGGVDTVVRKFRNLGPRVRQRGRRCVCLANGWKNLHARVLLHRTKRSALRLPREWLDKFRPLYHAPPRNG